MGRLIIRVKKPPLPKAIFSEFLEVKLIKRQTRAENLIFIKEKQQNNFKGI